MSEVEFPEMNAGEMEHWRDYPVAVQVKDQVQVRVLEWLLG